jgi:hypothetical protein
MADLYDFLTALGSLGWSVVKRNRGLVELNEEITTRYHQLPGDYLRFLSAVEFCANGDQTAWFLCESDYNGVGNSAYRWNEFEAQALEAAAGDETWEREIRDFWSDQFPILLSTKNGYAFLAIRVSGTDFGQIVVGREPDYQDVDVVASSFGELVRSIVSAAREGELPAVLANVL